MATKGKPRAKRKAAAKDLAPRQAARVKGGRKAGEGQQDYFIVKMDSVRVTS
jgi:hypothetical protein